MARITVEDCLRKVGSRFELVVLAAGRAKLLLGGAKSGVETDNSLSLALYQQAEQILVEDVACLPLWFGKNYILVNSHIKGYNLSPQGAVMLNSVSIEHD